MSAAAGTFVEELGRALREVRWRRKVSQRELAEQLGVSKSWVGRLESGDVPAALAAVSRVAADLGLAVTLAQGPAVAPADGGDAGGLDGAVPQPTPPRPIGGTATTAWAATTTAAEPAAAVEPALEPAGGPAPPAPAPVRLPGGMEPGRNASFTTRPEAAALVERWRARADRERVRDAAGRRMPAHLVAYPMSYPHHWWFVRHPLWSLRRRPIWSFTFRTPRAAAVLLVGDNPPPLGLHPDGGWPMQGRPGDDVRAQWPPTFPVRPRWYPPPLTAA